MVVITSGYDVRQAVIVKIDDSEVGRIGARGVIDRGLEGAVAVAEEDRYPALADVEAYDIGQEIGRASCRERV